MDAPCNLPKKRRGFRFSLLSVLVVFTAVGMYLGWRARITGEEMALAAVRPKLDGVFFDWEEPTLKKMSPIQPEYITMERQTDGTQKEVTGYHDDMHLITPTSQASPPEPDWIDRCMGRTSARTHVVAVLLPNYNATDDVLSALSELPYLQRVVVRRVYEASADKPDKLLSKVRSRLPGVEVVGEIWKLHPANEK